MPRLRSTKRLNRSYKPGDSLNLSLPVRGPHARRARSPFFINKRVETNTMWPFSKIINEQSNGHSDVLQDRARLDLEYAKLENKVMQETLDLYGSWVDPIDALRDENGELWQTIGGVETGAFSMDYIGWRAIADLTRARWQCRWLSRYNPYAINVQENRVNYVYGTGHTYTVTPRQGTSVSDETILQLQTFIDNWCRQKSWPLVQQEIMWRYDRDGETFMRFYLDFDGNVDFRFVECWQIQDGGMNDAPFGVLTEPDDVSTVRGFYVDGNLVDAKDMQHRKANVDNKSRRGVPTLYPVTEGLRRAQKLMRNMIAASDIQTAIAMIRKHATATSSAVSTFRSSLAQATSTNQNTGEQRFFSPYRPASILDAPAGMEYQFPHEGIDASRYVLVLDAQLREIAARLNMPEFMVSANAANGNYASTMVAEGPHIKQIERLQATQQSFDLEILKRVILGGEAAGKLPVGIEQQVHVHVGLPQIQVRDSLKDAQVAMLNMQMGILSPQTACTEAELDFHQEEENIAAYKKAHPDWTPPGQAVVDDQGTQGDKAGGDTQGGDNQNTAKATAKKLAKESVDALVDLERLYP